MWLASFRFVFAEQITWRLLLCHFVVRIYQKLMEVLPFKQKPHACINSLVQYQERRKIMLIKIINNAYNRSGIHPCNPELYQLAKEVLFPLQEVQMWLDHLESAHQHCKAGTRKAAETHRKNMQKKQQQEKRARAHKGYRGKNHVDQKDDDEMLPSH